MRILLLTGPGGDAQGWGDMSVTRSVAEAVSAAGHEARTAYVETEAEFRRTLDAGGFDLVWSALYHISSNEKFIGRNEEGLWVADALDGRGIPYVGSDSRIMKDMIDKFATHTILARAGVPVPAHRLLGPDDDPAGISYPAFVKPMCESRSVGISDESVVADERELRRRVEYVAREFAQAALVEDFLPGDEYTALVLGNGAGRQCLPGRVRVEEKHYGRHNILRSDLRGVGLTRIHEAGERAEEVAELAGKAVEAMGCLDHVRIDLKADAAGALRIMEVNGIPGLKPRKSWAPQLYTLHHASPLGEMDDYRNLIKDILISAWGRA